MFKNSDRVKVQFGTEWYFGHVTNKGKQPPQGKHNVLFDDGELLTCHVDELHEAKKGRASLNTCDPDQLSKQIKELLVQLTEAKDVEEKKRIRRALRRRGHTGGLGIRAAK